MDGLVEKLLRLEGAKHKALVEIDAFAYDASVRKQMRLLAIPQLITLNTRLLQTLVSTTPWFALS